MGAPDQLPPEADDHGDRIVVAPDRGTRMWAAAGATLAVAVAVLLLVTGDGPVGVVAGAAAAMASVYLLLLQARRIEFDAETARRRSLLRPTTIAWSEVTEAMVGRRYARTPVIGSSRVLGGLTLSMGSGGRRRGRGLRRDEPVTVLSVKHQAAGPDLTMELNRSDIAHGEALLATLSDRGWLPDEVTITIDADR